MRTIKQIAKEIRADWKKVSPYAEPYLKAMEQLEKVTDRYYFDDAESVILYFLSNASSWRGNKAREIKKELKDKILNQY